jgi:hypothetical protein
MTALYVIAHEYQAAARTLADLDLDPQTVADTLEGMSGALEVKAQSVAMMVRVMEADAAAVAQWAKDANARAKAIENRADALRDYLKRTLESCGITKVDGPGITIGFRKSSAVVIDDPDQLPAEFMVTPPAPPPAPPAPSKTLIGDAIKAGREVPGARIEHRTNLQIK